jgi:hypothetical protein
VKLISDLIDAKKTTLLETGVIWGKYKELLPDGEEDGRTKYTSPQFDEISQKTLNEIFQDKFQAKPPTHTGKKRELKFNLDVLNKLKRKYRIIDDKKDPETDETDETDETHSREQSKGSQQGNNNTARENTQQNAENNVKPTQDNVNSTSAASDTGPNVDTIVSGNASQVSQENSSSTNNQQDIRQVLGTYVAWDLEWTDDGPIEAASFVDSTGKSEVKFRDRDFQGSEVDFLKYIMNKIRNYHYSIGWYTQGNNQTGGSIIPDLRVLYERCRVNGISSIVKLGNKGMPRITGGYKHIDLCNVYGT